MSVEQWTALTMGQRLYFLDDPSTLSQGRFKRDWPLDSTAYVHNRCKVAGNGKDPAGIFVNHSYHADHWLMQPAKPRRPVVEYNFCPPKEKKVASRSKKVTVTFEPMEEDTSSW